MKGPRVHDLNRDLEAAATLGLLLELDGVVPEEVSK